jgi:hypothetical protein
MQLVNDLSRVETGSNISTVALRVVGRDEKGTHCVQAFQIGGVSNLMRLICSHEYHGIVGSNPTHGMNICTVCVYYVFVLRVGRGLATG